MALIKVDFFSNALLMQASFYAVIPQKNTEGEIGNEKSEENRTNLLLLHGLSDDETIWMRRTSIERYADKYGFNVFMPCGGRSFYTDMKYGGKYYTYIARELPRYAERLFGIGASREDRYVAGLSMGGYGALKIALKENDFFAGGAALSPAVDLKNPIFKETLTPVFGEGAPVPDEEDLFFLTEKFNNREKNPRLLTIDGHSDFMIDDYYGFLKHMDKLDYDFIHKEYEGSHNWDFWDAHIVEVLEWIKNK